MAKSTIYVIEPFWYLYCMGISKSITGHSSITTSKFPKITVASIVLTNTGSYEESLKSVSSQNYPNLEHIIIATESSIRQIRQFVQHAKNIRVYCIGNYHNESNAVKKAFGYSTGKIFYWMNCEVKLAPYVLFHIAECFETRSIHLLSGYLQVHVGDNEFTLRNPKIMNLPEDIFSKGINQPGTFFLKEIIEQLGGINDCLKYCFDLELWIKYLLRFGIKDMEYSPRVFAEVRLTENSLLMNAEQGISQETDVIFDCVKKDLFLTERQRTKRYKFSISLDQFSSVDISKLRYFAFVHTFKNRNPWEIWKQCIDGNPIAGIKIEFSLISSLFLKYMYRMLEQQWAFQKVKWLRFLEYIYVHFLDILYNWKILQEKNIPIIINNHNRFSFLKQLVAWLKNNGYNRIYILDNSSECPPLLDYYNSCNCDVIKLAKNIGHLALWNSGIYEKFKWNYFVYTDPDVLPVDECPEHFMSQLRTILSKYKEVRKIGFSLKIDDLPDHNPQKAQILQVEKPYWRNLVEDNLFRAPVDTTFALYRPFSNLKNDQAYTIDAFRAGYPLMLRHLPWYLNSLELEDEEIYYISKAKSYSTWAEKIKSEVKL